MTKKKNYERSPFFTLDDLGTPVESEHPDLWQNHPGDPRFDVGEATIEGPSGAVLVSTKFLSIDMQYGDGPPLVWETMAFYIDHTLTEHGLETTWRNELIQVRHSTLRSAQRAFAAVSAATRLLVETPEVTNYDSARAWMDGYCLGTDREDGNEDEDDGPTTE